jgi:hypothetical protein
MPMNLDVVLSALQIFLTVTGSAIVSGIILLYVHYRERRKELDDYASIRQFDTKRRVYRVLWEYPELKEDVRTFMESWENWRKLRVAYHALLLVGSPSVIEKLNDLIIRYEKASEAERTKLVKDLWLAMRNDLYPREKVSLPLIKFIQPLQPSSSRVAEIFSKNETLFAELAIRSILDVSKYTLDELARKTGLAEEDLRFLLEISERENRFKEEAQKLDEKL